MRLNTRFRGFLVAGIGGLGVRKRFFTTFLELEFSEVTFWLEFSAIYFLITTWKI